MDKQKKRMDRMNGFVAGTDLGVKESVATYMAPGGDVRERLSFR